MDQVSYEFQMKLSKDYNSGGVTVGFKTDIREGETEADAMKRCIEFVEDTVDSKIKDLEEIYG